MAKVKIGMVGLGYVGGALRHWFELAPEKYDLYFYDKYKEVGSPEEVNKAGIIFVAVPTPYYDKKSACHEVHPVRSRARGQAASPNRTAGAATSNGVRPAPAANVAGYDDSAVRDVLENTIKDGKVVVIKSSVLPGSTDKFQKKHPKKTLLFNPEFLTANNAVEDFLHPHRQIVGYTDKKSQKMAPKVMKILPRAPFEKVMPAREAELVKFFGNTFLAARVIFANQMYDLCEAIGADYDLVREAAGHDPRIGHSHFDVMQDGYRGYSGLCLPKDTKALLQFAGELGVDVDFIKKMDEVNERLRKG